ncbi:MAG: hypothetical protein U5K31_12470, partial [Balneolaceae bacterium]|nr:hypothetical protein [Balneolaceae bacterium]
GTADSLGADLALESSHYGSLALEGGVRTAPPHRYALTLEGRDVDAAPLLGHPGDSTRINFTSRLDGTGFRLQEAVSEISATITDSRLYGVPVDSLVFRASLQSGELSHSYDWRAGRQSVSGKGSVTFTGREPAFSLQGGAGDLDLAQLLPGGGAPVTRLNLDYNVAFRGTGPDSLQGQANLDIARSAVAGDTLEPHQFYVDLNRPDSERRSLRLTSTFLDLTLNGTIVPSRIAAEMRFWADHLPRRFRREVMMSDSAGVQDSTGRLPVLNPGHTLSLDGTAQVKNVGMLRSYVPGLPEVSTDASLEFNINTSGPTLLLSGTLDADSLRWGETRLRNGNMQVTANVRSDRPFRDYASLEFQSHVGTFSSGALELDSVVTRLTANGDSLGLTQHVGQVGGEARLDLAMSAVLEPDRLEAAVERFQLGNEEYAWRSEERPTLVYTEGRELFFNDFVFRNREEFMRVSGVMSPDPSHALEYTIRNVNLARISSLVQGQLGFSGQLNGDLITRSLTRQPSVQGELRVRRLTLADRLVGDVHFSSRLNEEDSRFDTRIEILTDSTRYADYLEANNQIGQDIVLDGWFVAPDLNAPQDTVYHFDAQFNEVDLWVLSHIVNPINQVEGRASGSGWLAGNLRDYDFHADFELRDVYLKPSFLETEYYANGPVAFDRQEGVVLDSLALRDTRGGTGQLWGNIDLNEFRPITYLDLTLQMDGLRFLNNSFDPDLPFYGAVAGTGTARISGSNTKLLLRTESPIQVTSDSRITVPLLEETELSESGRFIRFVDSFDQRDPDAAELERGEVDTGLQGEALQTAIENLTFSERFNLDLQFNAPDGVNVDLVFDRVTGEALSSRGTGQIRLTMQDEEVQMFGRYDITGGTYRFVASDVISRELDLEQGGDIVWQGDPANAQMNISAVYRARPDISLLNYRGTGLPDGGLGEETGRRVPVELVVEITGTVSSVRNNYFFRMPNSLDLSSNSTLSYTISQINRDEQQKLLQAASILLTDRFIPVQNTDQATTTLSQSLTRGSTVLNPLISNQVISPLLSNQINSLLNSEVSRFDIDFNLNTYNQIDLGIALRLYNDRLILRREGQITGETSIGDRIGDLNATYRIRRGLSLTAFHRQDQVFGTAATGSQTTDVTPSVDGIGLEAEVQFNTWQELKRRIGDFFRAIFGGDDDEEENDEIAQQK